MLGTVLGTKTFNESLIRCAGLSALNRYLSERPVLRTCAQQYFLGESDQTTLKDSQLIQCYCRILVIYGALEKHVCFKANT